MDKLETVIKDLATSYKIPLSKNLENELIIIIGSVFESAKNSDNKKYLDFLRLARAKDQLIVTDNIINLETKNAVFVYTDGACSENPGAGGWAAVILHDDKKIELSGGDLSTTNNRMELLATINALKYIEANSIKQKVSLTTDSQYVKNGITTWVHGWKKNNWKTSAKEDVKNKDLWLELDHLNNTLIVEWSWVKGHSGHYYNELCDTLACKERDSFVALKLKQKQ